MRAKFVFERLGFSEDGDPIKDMGIGIEAEDKKHVWDWRPIEYPFINDEEILDIIEYRGFHIKIMRITRFEGKFHYEPFYIAITDIGEPYVGDGPYKFDTPEKAIKSGKDSLDNYLDD